MKNIKVSIWCITYNHIQYIKDAIEGFLMQETNFAYEILIHDDASNDGTSELVKTYEDRYPDKIKCIIQKENIYSKGLSYATNKKLRDMLPLTSGKYVAMCEGDDFWLDRNKLQIQVDYMEAHPECSMLAHNAVVFDVPNSRIDGAINAYKGNRDISVEELIMWYNGNHPTASVMMKTEFQRRPELFLGVTSSGDWALQLYCATRGRVHYMDRIMSCYRRGVNESLSYQQLKNHKASIQTLTGQLFFLIGFNEYTDYQYDKYIQCKIYEKYFNILWYCRDLPSVQFDSMLEEICENNEYKDEGIICKIKYLFKNYADKDFFREVMQPCFGGGKKVLLMGAGKWGKKFGKRLLEAGLDIEGYLVSEGRRAERIIQGSKVYEVQEILEREKYLVIMVMDPRYLIEMQDTLERYQYPDFRYFLDL